jgi:hypothetical protein
VFIHRERLLADYRERISAIRENAFDKETASVLICALICNLDNAVYEAMGRRSDEAAVLASVLAELENEV